eukprot:4899068-Prymnesium_polylepis.1
MLIRARRAPTTEMLIRPTRGFWSEMLIRLERGAVLDRLLPASDSAEILIRLVRGAGSGATADVRWITCLEEALKLVSSRVVGRTRLLILIQLHVDFFCANAERPVDSRHDDRGRSSATGEPQRA